VGKEKNGFLGLPRGDIYALLARTSDGNSPLIVVVLLHDSTTVVYCLLLLYRVAAAFIPLLTELLYHDDLYVLLAFVAMMVASLSSAFVPSSVRRAPHVVVKAGGFEWEDPTESFDRLSTTRSRILIDQAKKACRWPFRLLGPSAVETISRLE
jgi:hypothetical protein